MALVRPSKVQRDSRCTRRRPHASPDVALTRAPCAPQVMARRKTGPPRSMRLEQAQQVSALLLPRYAAKYERMGVPERMPGRKAYLELLANKPPTPPPAALAVAGEEGGAAKGGAEGDAAPAPAVEAAPAPA